MWKPVKSNQIFLKLIVPVIILCLLNFLLFYLISASIAKSSTRKHLMSQHEQTIENIKVALDKLMDDILDYKNSLQKNIDLREYIVKNTPDYDRRIVHELRKYTGKNILLSGLFLYSSRNNKFYSADGTYDEYDMNRNVFVFENWEHKIMLISLRNFSMHFYRVAQKVTSIEDDCILLAIPHSQLGETSDEWFLFLLNSQMIRNYIGKFLGDSFFGSLVIHDTLGTTIVAAGIDLRKIGANLPYGWQNNFNIKTVPSARVQNLYYTGAINKERLYWKWKEARTRDFGIWLLLMALEGCIALVLVSLNYLGIPAKVATHSG